MDADIAAVAALIGDPARSRMLLALMGGRALTATELALEADVAPSTASAHLARLAGANLIRAEKQGRHRYFAIADESVAELIEQLCGVAARDFSPKVKTGPSDPAMREARVCYDHLAGEIAVALYDSLVAAQWIEVVDDALLLTAAGRDALARLGVELPAASPSRRPLCRRCLDWSERRHHLAGGVGAAILAHALARGWASRDLVTRAVHFTPAGRRELERAFGLAAAA